MNPAAAASTGWADFADLNGTSRMFTTTMSQRPGGFPVALVTTDSVGGSSVGVQNGSSTFLPAQTPVGQKYGSSHSQPYLTLRPNRVNGPPPSVTTYSFERPTPTSGWTFVLGDIDADQVTISGTGPDGTPVPPAGLGFRGVFNYCTADMIPRPECPPAKNDGSALPSWDAVSGTLLGDSEADDTAGASAWFEPTAPLSSLTLRYAQRSGNPVYQTWFSALAYNISGTVSAPAGQRSGITVRLFDPSGEMVSQTQTAADGSYIFPGQATYNGYRAEVLRPNGLASDGPLARLVDLSSGDQTGVDFTLRAMMPVQASGTVTDTETKAPMPGVKVMLIGPTDLRRTGVTDADGNYLFDNVPVGQNYLVTVEVPTGFSGSPAGRSFNVPANSEAPVGGLDFEMTPAPAGSVSGTVRSRGPNAGVGNVGVSVTGPDGLQRIARTAPNGSYRLSGLPPGAYRISVEPPTGAEVVGDADATFTIAGGGNDINGEDFRLQRAAAVSYTVSGAVTDTGRVGVADVTVVLTTPQGREISATTAGDGTFAFPDLAAGAGYTATVKPPERSSLRGRNELRFDITGRDVDTLAFTVSAGSRGSDPTASSTPTPTSSTLGSASATPVAADALPFTGGPPRILLVGGVAALLLGGVLIVVGRVRTTRPRAGRRP
jgi:hypothetical protein